MSSSNLSKLTQVTTITDLSRVLFSTTDSSFITIGNEATTDSSHNLAFTTALDTYNDFFVKSFQLKTQTAGDTTNFRIDSELHCVYSVDVSNDTLLFRENWGKNRNASCGYLLFDFTASHLKVTGRWVYNVDTSYHIVDSEFTQADKYVKYDNGVLKLVSSISDATVFKMYNFPFDVAVPYDFNPGQIAYQTNDRVSIVNYIDKTISNMETLVAQKMKSKYLSQISEKGNSTTTASAADKMITTIKTKVASFGGLRYDKSIYTAFRNGLLSRINNTDSIANGERGQNTVPYVYFTLEKDVAYDASAGYYHPFMCIASYSITDRPNHLLDVPRPPGDGTGDYESTKVTRDATLQDYLFKIPMRDYGLIENLTENDMTTTLYDDYKETHTDYSVEQNVYNYSSKSGLGVTIDGLVMYPILNNTVVPAQSVAEITSSGFHVGRGMGLHYHADGHGATDNSFNLYNTDDYVGKNHPPLVGFGFDGIALFGRYEHAYSSMLGYSVGLDAYGGHAHDDLPYHYHCHTVTVTNGQDASGVTLFLEDNSVTSLYDGERAHEHPTYDLHLLIKGAWKGQINNIPYFWTDTISSVTDTNGNTVLINTGEPNAPSYSLSQKHKYVGKDYSV